MSKRKFTEEKTTIDPEFFETPKQKPFMQILYDKKEGTVLGRNAKSWGKIDSIKNRKFNS